MTDFHEWLRTQITQTRSDFLPTRRYAIARVLATALCLSVCLYVSGSVRLSQVGVLSKCMDGLMWFVDMEASFDQSYIVVIRKFRYLQNKGTSLWNFFLNSEL